MNPKILFLAQTPPPIHGASLLSEALVTSRSLNSFFDIELLRIDFAKDLKSFGKLNPRKFFKFFIFLFNMIYYLLKFRPDLVYFTISPLGGAFYRDVLFVLILKIFRKKILYHLHGKGIKNNCLGLKKILYRMVLKNTDVICLSEYLTSDIQNVFDGVPYVVNNGIALEINDDKYIKKIDLNLKIIFLSNLAESKGVYTFVDALKILSFQNVSCEASIYGDSIDVDIDEFQQEIQEIEIRTRYHGPIYGDEKFEALLDSSIFVLPTANEAFPGVVLEAMQCGLPVISTFEGGIPDIVDDGVTGFLVPSKDPEALAEKIQILIEDPALRQKMGEAGRKKFLDKYTQDKFEENMKKVFDDVLSNID